MLIDWSMTRNFGPRVVRYIERAKERAQSKMSDQSMSPLHAGEGRGRQAPVHHIRGLPL